MKAMVIYMQKVEVSQFKLRGETSGRSGCIRPTMHPC